VYVVIILVCSAENAKEALELARMQETTRQIEFQAKVKVGTCVWLKPQLNLGDSG